MAYKQQSPIVVAEGGTGAITLTDHGVLLGSGTAAITPLAAAATGETLMGNSGADPSFTGSPSFSGTVTAATGLIATLGGVNAQGNSGINTNNLTAPTATTDIGTGSIGAITIGNNSTTGLLHIIAGAGGMTIDTSGGGALLIGGNVSQGTITINSRTSALSFSNDAFATTVNIATAAAAKTVTLGSTNTTSTTTIQAGSGGINLTGAVTSANAITITSGNLAITAATTSAVGQITQAGTPILHTMGGATNIFVGSGAGNLTLTATNSVGIGNLALSSLTSGGSNTAVGVGALDDVTTGVRNTAVGYLALENNTSDNNVAIGVQALQGAAASTAQTNVAIGYLAMAVATSCTWNVAVGSSALDSITSGSFNSACGFESLGTITTGAYNVGVGFIAGRALTVANSSNICINAQGTAGDNNTLRIGDGAGAGNQQLNRAFIHGIRGITTGNADAIAVLVDSAGQLGTVSSSKRFKENIQDMGLASNMLMYLRPVTFNYKSDEHKTMQFGLIAEEVQQFMPELVVKDREGLPESIKYHDLPVLLLNEIQKLEKRIRELEKEVREG